MSLVFRTDQTTPLTNDQVDNNFKYLRDQILLKYNISDFTATRISSALNTLSQGQATYDLSQANAINAWKVRDLEPFSALPVTTSKTSLVARDINGDIYVSTVHGILDGNATTATSATSAGKLTNPVQINGVNFDGSASITVADSTKLPLTGGTMTGKLNLVNSVYHFAPMNLGAAVPDDNAKVNGDFWATSSGLFFYVGNTTYQVAPLTSPTFTGSVRAPGYTGTSDQVITLSHLSNATTTLNTAIALKANADSAALTGIPTAPTAVAGTNTTQLATTAFVKTALDNKASDIIAADKSYTDTSVINLSNSINTLLAAKASLASPVFTGTPSAPTPAVGNNSTQVATTAFIASAIAGIQANLNAAVAALNDSMASSRPVPVGSVFYSAAATVPYGYLEANGQTVSNTTYSALWIALGSPLTTQGDAIGTFRVPDLRGEFIRGWDHGRGVDNGRTLASPQGENIGIHTHDFYDVYAVSGDQPGNYNLVNGVPTPTGTTPANNSGLRDVDSNLVSQYYYMQNASDGDYDGGAYAFKNRTLPPTNSTELRPRNIALMPIIKW